MRWRRFDHSIWEYGKQLKERLLSAHLRRLTHGDSAQLTNLRCQHHSRPYAIENEDGSRCQRCGLCSRRWMTSTPSARWTRREDPGLPRFQRRASIDVLSILCLPRVVSISLEPLFPLGWFEQLERLQGPKIAEVQTETSVP